MRQLRVSADDSSAAPCQQRLRAACAYQEAPQALLGWLVVAQLCQAEAQHLQMMGPLASELGPSRLHLTPLLNAEPWAATETRAVQAYASS